MNKLEILLKKWKEGNIKDPNLSLCLSYINAMQLEQHNERKSTNIEGTDSVSGENNSIKPKRFKTKGL
jgi:hypothetical protein